MAATPHPMPIPALAATEGPRGASGVGGAVDVGVGIELGEEVTMLLGKEEVLCTETWEDAAEAVAASILALSTFHHFGSAVESARLSFLTSPVAGSMK